MSEHKKHIRLTDDLSATDYPTVKMVCDCGWVEKAFLQDAVLRATNHVRERHNGGVVHYKNWTRAVDKNGMSKAVNHNETPKFKEPKGSRRFNVVPDY